MSVSHECETVILVIACLRVVRDKTKATLISRLHMIQAQILGICKLVVLVLGTSYIVWTRCNGIGNKGVTFD